MSTTPRTIVISTALNKSNILELPQSANLSTSVMDTLYGDDEGGGPKKRRRLTHLSSEEKMMRRKLKNRVAAQTARDRKKDLMSTLESRLAKIMEENKKLLKENNALRNQSGALVQENSILKERLGAGSPSKPESEYPGSAVLFAPLPQEQTRTQSHWTMPLATSYLTSLLSFMQQDVTKSEKGSVAVNAPPTKSLIKTKPAPQAGSVVGPSATELESLNELIKFDHVYYKIEPSDGQSDCLGQNKSQKVIVVSCGKQKNSKKLLNIHITKDENFKKVKSAPVEECIVIDDDKTDKVVSSTTTDNNCQESVLDFSSLLPEVNLDLLEDIESILASDLDSQFDLDSVVDFNSQNGMCTSSQPQTLEVPVTTSKRNKRKLSDLIDTDFVPCVTQSEDVFSLSESMDTVSDSGFSSDSFSDAASPCRSDAMGGLAEDSWEESFMELFPALV